MSTQPGIEAAGGVLWRPGPRIAVVHRPAYDDWSLPKGKLYPGEPALLAALREVAEETAWDAVPAQALGEVHYEKAGRPKRVRYWSLRATDGRFTASDEVDRLEWLPAAEALALLDTQGDAEVLGRFLANDSATWPLIVVRHASAGDAAAWAGPDADRPLDARGEEQAALLADLLAPYQPAALMSADVTRCAQTLAPLAARLGLDVTSTELLSEQGARAHAAQALDVLWQPATSTQAAVVCSQGGALPELVIRLCARLALPQADLRLPKKGDGWVLHVTGGPKPRLVQIDPLAGLV